MTAHQINLKIYSSDHDRLKSLNVHDIYQLKMKLHDFVTSFTCKMILKSLLETQAHVFHGNNPLFADNISPSKYYVPL